MALWYLSTLVIVVSLLNGYRGVSWYFGTPLRAVYNSLYNILHLESPLSHYYFLTTARLGFPSSLFEPFRFFIAIQTFLYFSQRFTSFRHVALRESWKSCDFTGKHSKITICLEKLRFLSRHGSFWRSKSPKKVRKSIKSQHEYWTLMVLRGDVEGIWGFWGKVLVPSTVYNPMQECNTIANAIDNAIDNSFHNTLYLESLFTITFSLPRYYHFLTTTFAFSSLSLSHYCSSRVLTFSIWVFSAFVLLFRLFSTFRYVSLVLATLHFKESWESCDFTGKHSKVTICLEKLRFLCRDGSFLRSESPKKVRKSVNFKEIMKFDGRRLIDP